MKNYFAPILNRLAIVSFLLFAGMIFKNSVARCGATTTANLIAGLKPITPYLNRETHTVSLLYVNNTVVQQVLNDTKAHINGEVYVLFTWKQQPDPNWIGANLPGSLISAEEIRSTVNADGKVVLNYRCFKGSSLSAETDTTGTNRQMHFILNLSPAVMP